MNKNPPTTGRVAAMVLFTLSVFALLLFLWVSFGGTLPLKAKGYRFKADFPEAALLAKEADVRMAGVNIGKVRSTELGPGGHTTKAEIEIDSRFAPIRVDARAILRQKSLLGETYVELSPGQADSPKLADGGTLKRTNVQDTVELDEVFQAFDPRTRRYFQEWLHDAGIASTGRFASDLNDSLGNAAPFVESGADLLRPLDEQEVALRRVVRDTGRTFHAISRENGQLRGVITNGDATFSALASRDDALAQTFQILPTFLRETRATVGRLEQFARNTDPLVRDLRGPADDLAPTVRDLGDLSPDLEKLFNNIGPLVDASATGVPAAQRFLVGAAPVLESTHVFLRQLNPILSYLSFSRGQVSQFLSLGASSLGGTGKGGYQGNGAGEHYLSQLAIIDSRSLQQRSTRPPWERGNAYVAPNAYDRAIPLGVIESFDCNPNGGEQRDPAGSGGDAEPPCFVAPKQLFQNQQYPRLEAGHAPVVDAPTGTEGNSPATP
jgi:phospholipid/cholesterol/gamma-HCH transport system substrate-binding protein